MQQQTKGRTSVPSLGQNASTVQSWNYYLPYTAPQYDSQLGQPGHSFRAHSSQPPSFASRHPHFRGLEQSKYSQQGIARHGVISPPVTNVLKEWLKLNPNNPQPSDDTLAHLSQITGVPTSQITAWFEKEEKAKVGATVDNGLKRLRSDEDVDNSSDGGEADAGVAVKGAQRAIVSERNEKRRRLLQEYDLKPETVPIKSVIPRNDQPGGLQYAHQGLGGPTNFPQQAEFLPTPYHMYPRWGAGGQVPANYVGMQGVYFPAQVAMHPPPQSGFYTGVGDYAGVAAATIPPHQDQTPIRSPLQPHTRQRTQDNTSRKAKRKNFSKEVTDILMNFFMTHLQYPYPTEEEKNALSDKTGLEVRQVAYWFVNARKRIWHDLLEKQKGHSEKEENGEASVGQKGFGRK